MTVAGEEGTVYKYSIIANTDYVVQIIALV